MNKYSYDKEADVFHISISGKHTYSSSEEVPGGIIFDYSTKGKIMAIEFLDFSCKIEQSELK